MQKKIDNFSDDEIYNFIKQSKSFRQLMIKLGFSTKGSGDYVYVKNQLNNRKIKYECLLRLKSSNGATLVLNEIGKIIEKYSNTEVFIENSKLSRDLVKKRIITQKLLPYVCAECGLIDSWNDKPLVLQLEHKNGINNDNRLENLCFLCPNCHSQTATYCSKKTKKYFYCSCGDKKLKTSAQCLKCANNQKKKTQPELQTLIEDIKMIGFSKTGKKYNVSDNAIRKWVKSYGVDPKSIKK